MGTFSDWYPQTHRHPNLHLLLFKVWMCNWCRHSCMLHVGKDKTQNTHESRSGDSFPWTATDSFKEVVVLYTFQIRRRKVTVFWWQPQSNIYSNKGLCLVPWEYLIKACRSMHWHLTVEYVFHAVAGFCSQIYTITRKTFFPLTSVWQMPLDWFV